MKPISYNNTLYFIDDERDVNCLLKENNFNESSSLVIGLNLKARFALEEFGISYSAEKEIVNSIDKIEIERNAKTFVYNYFEINFEKLGNNLNFDALIAIQFQEYYLFMYEIFQSVFITSKIIEKYRPEKIILHHRNASYSPYSAVIGNIMTGNNYFDCEVIKVIAQMKNIECAEYFKNRKHLGQVILKKSIVIFKNYYRYYRNILMQIYRWVNDFKNSFELNCSSFLSSGKNKKRIVFFVYGDHYAEDYMDIIIELANNGFKILIMLIGGDLTSQQIKSLKEKDIIIFKKYHFLVFRELSLFPFIYLRSLIYFFIKKFQYNKKKLNRQKDDIYSLFLLRRLSKTLFNQIQLSLLNFGIGKRILKDFRPHIVVSQFALHGEEIAYSLPFAFKGIPTICVSHGVTGYHELKRETSLSEYFFAEGRNSKNLIANLGIFEREKIFPIGLRRFSNKSKKIYDLAKLKGNYSFKNIKPVIVFCDSSIFSHNVCYRYSTYDIINIFLSLAEENKDFTYIFRVHHGSDTSAIELIFKKTLLKNVSLSISPKPLFMELVKKANIVVAYHSSAISESVYMGVPVILFEEFAVHEPLYDSFDGIEKANDTLNLKNKINELIFNSDKRQELLQKSKEFSTAVILDDENSIKLKFLEAIESILNRPKTQDGVLIQWHNRVKNSLGM